MILGPAPSADEWHQILVAVGSDTARLFVDGVASLPVEYVPGEMVTTRSYICSIEDQRMPPLTSPVVGAVDELRYFDEETLEEGIAMTAEFP